QTAQPLGETHVALDVRHQTHRRRLSAEAVRPVVMDKRPVAVNRRGNHRGVCGGMNDGLPPDVAPMRR
ncbi:hypothetical protein, partial [Brevundimonas sp.]|uniref:hypothetical protein n=1 Tax=Brevundimonas sp. TaxID=1871086 RepID=UPI0025BE11A5